MHEEWCRMKNSHDKNGPKAKNIVLKMNEMGIKYNILMINQKLNAMVEVFKSLGGSDLINTFEMKEGLKFDEITDSITSQIQTSVDNKRNNLLYRVAYKDPIVTKSTWE